ncbi:RagB/SusD family nutrient uptake outer membrane protein [uncultured Bacteroides sp.]|uniref:RagB/SusD family nutrient uptake outer membrane protein n=1 Tax=uncultured Bacteroides sp. TaxID=162156 RepID=UPI002AA6BCD2|nr:RagB/SusD family nutrient uptake outer membrane protein [uncultured Bacteroides sp.]
MKKIYKYIGAALISASFFTACTGAFDKMNTDPMGVSDEELKQDNNYVGMNYIPLQKSIYYNESNGNWEYQLIQNLNADIWSGYMASGTNFNGGINNQTYALNAGWDDYCWNYAYNSVMSPSYQAKKKCAADMETYSHFDAINSILRVLAMSRISDQYGPIIYSQYGSSKTGGTYDSGQDAYKEFFVELKDAATKLAAVQGKTVASFASFDLAYNGDLAKWGRLCNTLRLRLAMRIVKYDAALAKQEAEAAVADGLGLIEDNADNFTISGKGYTNPLYVMTAVGQYHDILLNANVTSILGGYADPRLVKYAQKNSDGNIVGLRTGIPDLDKHPEYKGDNVTPGKISALYLDNGTTPVVLATAAETYFLLAEGALRGWNVGGTSENFYEKGIETSFDQWGATLGDYLNNGKKPADFVDVLDPQYNIKAVSKVSPKWSDATTDEERLEKIITQKWIAIYPEGMNAWAEYRRTGYPKLFPIMKNDSQGVIPTSLGVRRLPFTTDEKNNNPAGYADAVQKLGGPDNGATRVFWDIDKSNL